MARSQPPWLHPLNAFISVIGHGREVKQVTFKVANASIASQRPARPREKQHLSILGGGGPRGAGGAMAFQLNVDGIL